MAKQIKTFTAGSVLTASDVNSYLMNQAVIAAQSTDRPTSPSPGMTIWETDTKRLMVYQSATTGWTPPWNMAWGVVQGTSGGTLTSGAYYGYVKVTANQTITANTQTDVTSATFTFLPVANRLYRITAMFDGAKTVGSTATVVNFQLNVGGSAVASSVFAVNTPAANADRFGAINYVGTLSATSTIVKLTAASDMSGQGVIVQGAAATPTVLCVEDAGPAGPAA